MIGVGDGLAVLVFVAQSSIDRAIPQGLHPLVLSNGTGGAVDDKAVGGATM